MTPEQIRLVQSSFQKIIPISDTAADLFYLKLFELDPSLRPLFKGDIQEQGRKLMHMIHAAVLGLDSECGLLHHTIIPTVRNLGKRHASYGVQSKHYATVGAALLWTLEQGLGKDFTPETKTAWTDTYTLLAGVMQEAAA